MLDLVRRGVGAGLTAGFAVAAGVFVYDLVNLEPLATPDTLARNVVGAPLVATADLGSFAWLSGFFQRSYSVLGYTLVHLAAFALTGVLASWMFRGRGVPANLVTGALFGMLAGTAVFYAGYGTLAPSFVDAPAWQLVVTMNAFAGVVMVAMLIDEEGESQA